MEVKMEQTLGRVEKNLLEGLAYKASVAIALSGSDGLKQKEKQLTDKKKKLLNVLDGLYKVLENITDDDLVITGYVKQTYKELVMTVRELEVLAESCKPKSESIVKHQTITEEERLKKKKETLDRIKSIVKNATEAYESVPYAVLNDEVYMTDDCYTSLGLIETYRQLKMNASLAEDSLEKQGFVNESELRALEFKRNTIYEYARALTR